MAHETEAACLLRTGALYPRRIGLRDTAGNLVFIGVKHGALSIYVDEAPHLHIDLDGRWQRVFRDGIHYRKGLDGSVDAIDRVREGAALVLHRRELAPDEIQAIDHWVRHTAQTLHTRIQAAEFEHVPPPGPHAPLGPDELAELLQRAAAWDATAWADEARRYRDTYSPRIFLPPDAQQAVLLQATLGERGGRAFGHTPAEELRVRSPEGFSDHARDVARLLGRRLAQFRALYLGGPDLLHQPLEYVEEIISRAKDVFPLNPAIPASGRRSELPVEAPRISSLSFSIEHLASPLPDRAGWNRLRAMGLGRITIALESGDSYIRRLYGKDWSDAELTRVVSDLKAESIPVSILLLAGAGGQEQAASHVEKSAAALDRLPLSRGDLIFLIHATDVGDASLGRSVTPLDPDKASTQQVELKAAMSPLTDRGVKVLNYTTEKQ